MFVGLKTDLFELLFLLLLMLFAVVFVVGSVIVVFFVIVVPFVVNILCCYNRCFVDEVIFVDVDVLDIYWCFGSGFFRIRVFSIG